MAEAKETDRQTEGLECPQRLLFVLREAAGAAALPWRQHNCSYSCPPRHNSQQKYVNNQTNKNEVRGGAEEVRGPGRAGSGGFRGGRKVRESGVRGVRGSGEVRVQEEILDTWSLLGYATMDSTRPLSCLGSSVVEHPPSKQCVMSLSPT